jgi:hypothetical protein
MRAEREASAEKLALARTVGELEVALRETSTAATEAHEQARSARAEAAAGAGGALEQLEGSLVRMAEMLRRKDAELGSVRRIVAAECAERQRLLDRLEQLEPASGSAAPASMRAVAPGPASTGAAAAAPHDDLDANEAAWSNGLALARGSGARHGALAGGQAVGAALHAVRRVSRVI